METSNQPVLSICIPIYNRSEYLMRMLDEFLLDKDLFKDRVHLYISDNCSIEDLGAIVEEYKEKGLNSEYNRNNENLGSDGNFIKCFNSAKGKYLWLLGSDDIPIDGFVRKLVDLLEENDYGYIHLDDRSKGIRITEYGKVESLLERINVWLSFMSAHIFKADVIKSVDGPRYMGLFLVQVPYFLEGILSDGKKIVYEYPWIQGGSDAANNGGYNFMQVFAENLLGLINERVDARQISRECYEVFKKSLYKSFLAPFIVDLYLLRKPRRNNFSHEGAARIFFRHYGGKAYAYYYILRNVAGRVFYSIEDLLTKL